MRLFLLTTLTMVAFAANSVLTRAGVAEGGLDPMWFGVIRLAAGAVTLAGLTFVLRGRLQFSGAGRVAGVIGLLLYIFGFSLAYTALDAGMGALILFGTVQITMFAGAFLAGEQTPLLRYFGAALAFGGLVWLLWPQSGATDIDGAEWFMAAAGVGWGIYSLAGRKATDALSGTAANFVIAVPIAIVFVAALPVVEPPSFEWGGVWLAVISGSVTSGLGYALWYSVLPRLQGTIAAVAQLTVPVIAMAGGLVILGEPLSLDFVIAAAVVLGGVGVSLIKR